MDNFIFLPDRSKVSAGNSATGELSVALGKNCTASGDYSFADGSGCTTKSLASISMGRNCHTEIHGPDYGGQVAMGRDCSANGWGSVALGSSCTVTGAAGTAIGTGCVASSASVALGSSKAYAFNSIAIGEDNETNGWASVAMGSTCKTDASYNIALGKGADASGTGGFVYRSNSGNTFVFDDGDGSTAPALKINGTPVGGGGGSSSGGLEMLALPALTTPTWTAQIPGWFNMWATNNPNAKVKVTLIGGGGGGGGYTTTDENRGSGGGGGGSCVKWMPAGTAVTYTYIIGAGGTGAGDPTDGGGIPQPGFDSKAVVGPDPDGDIVLKATGGSPGQTPTGTLTPGTWQALPGGRGGDGHDGDFNMRGGFGGNGWEAGYGGPIIGPGGYAGRGWMGYGDGGEGGQYQQQPSTDGGVGAVIFEWVS